MWSTWEETGVNNVIFMAMGESDCYQERKILQFLRPYTPGEFMCINSAPCVYTILAPVFFFAWPPYWKYTFFILYLHGVLIIINPNCWIWIIQIFLIWKACSNNIYIYTNFSAWNLSAAHFSKFFSHLMIPLRWNRL